MLATRIFVVVAALATTAQEVVLEHSADPVHIQLQQVLVTRVLVKVVAQATTVQEAVLE